MNHAPELLFGQECEEALDLIEPGGACRREVDMPAGMPGMPERRSHDYKRNGTTSLFAALDTATGSVIGKCYRRHCARKLLNFLMAIDRNVPDRLDIHIVMDNYATRKTAAVKAWLARRPHWHVHF